MFETPRKGVLVGDVNVSLKRLISATRSIVFAYPTFSIDAQDIVVNSGVNLQGSLKGTYPIYPDCIPSPIGSPIKTRTGIALRLQVFSVALLSCVILSHLANLLVCFFHVRGPLTSEVANIQNRVLSISFSNAICTLMKVLVVGGGGREHTLAWKIGQSKRVDQVFVAPGNAGSALDAENVDIADNDIEQLVRFAKKQSIGMTVVGPEVPLCLGIVDAFRQQDLRVFGPSKEAAQLEGSKIFCKQMLAHAQVPTADYHEFDDAQSGIEFLNNRFPADEDNPSKVVAAPLVVKADGLASGKGAIVCSTRSEVFEAIDRIAVQKEFGTAGKRYIIEEKLSGQETSVLALTDGKTIITLPPAQDHKPAYDGDRGPNTGGMGAYCPTNAIDAETLSWVEANILVPTIHSMKRSRRPFTGILYAGLMMTGQGPRVIEYNVRFGDPECQAILMRLQTDIVDLFDAAIDRDLENFPDLQWDPRPSVCVVMASEGYPGKYDKGLPIRGLEEAAKIPDAKVFHAGTKLQGDQVVTNGGRVLGVTGIGASVSEAKRNAYAAVKCIRWPGAWCRKDISDKAML
jgi:phosphoribosylamine--glycine ligase